jgi:ribonuclease P protein component
VDQTYPLNEKLKSKKLIERLFSEGQSIGQYPLRMVYLESKLPVDSLLQAGVSVSKRNFKKAVSRNRIKRLLREAYRHNKSLLFNNLPTAYAFMILYIGKEEPTLAQVNSATVKLFEKLIAKQKA